MTKEEFDAAFRAELVATGMPSYSFESTQRFEPVIGVDGEELSAPFSFLSVRVDSPDGQMHDAFLVKNDTLTADLIRSLAAQSKSAFGLK